MDTSVEIIALHDTWNNNIHNLREGEN